MKINEYNFLQEARKDIIRLNKDWLDISFCSIFCYKYRGKKFLIESYGTKAEANLVGYFSNGERAYPVFGDYANNFNKRAYINIIENNKKNYKFLMPLNKAKNKILFGKLIDISFV